METTLTVTKIRQIVEQKRALQERVKKGDITMEEFKKRDKKFSNIIL